jgi:hypothetical protein
MEALVREAIMKTALKWALLALGAHTLVVLLLILVGERTFYGVGYKLERAQAAIDAPVERLVWHTGNWLGPLLVRAAEATGHAISEVTFPFAIFLYCFYGGILYFTVTFILAGAILLLKRAVWAQRPEKTSAT